MEEVKQKASLQNEKVSNVAIAAKEYEETRRQYFEDKLNNAEERRQMHVNSKKDKASQEVAKVEQANSNKELEVSVAAAKGQHSLMHMYSSRSNAKQSLASWNALVLPATLFCLAKRLRHLLAPKRCKTLLKAVEKRAQKRGSSSMRK